MLQRLENILNKIPTKLTPQSLEANFEVFWYLYDIVPCFVKQSLNQFLTMMQKSLR
jgi:hypothetical protein